VKKEKEERRREERRRSGVLFEAFIHFRRRSL